MQGVPKSKKEKCTKLTIAQKIRKFNKFAHCKCGKFCYFKHENTKCELVNCDDRNCHLRHPKLCLNVLLNKPCKFGKFCSFDHFVVDDQNASVGALNDKMAGL